MDGVIVSNKMIASNLYRLTLSAPSIAASARPGQFVNILVTESWQPLLRRPMSIAGVDGSHFDLLYKVVGEGTATMADWKAGKAVNILGPLGNGWDIDIDSYPVVIGGGAGIAPIEYLHNYFDQAGVLHHLIMGARTGDEHYLAHDPEGSIFLATDDGTLGIAGTVMDALLHWRSQVDDGTKTIALFACGPPRMMTGLKNYADDGGITCQLALEEIMACGIGLCQGCTVKMSNDRVTAHSYAERYRLVCIDGPVFAAEELA